MVYDGKKRAGGRAMDDMEAFGFWSQWFRTMREPFQMAVLVFRLARATFESSMCV